MNTGLKRVGTYVVIAIGLAAGISTPAQQQRQLPEGPCTVVNTAVGVPDSVKKSYAVATKEKEFQMAEPGKPFQATDVVVWPHLPWRRLLFAGQCGDRWFVHYERGGYAHSYGVLVFLVDAKGTATSEWGRWLAGPAKGIGELRETLRATKSDEDRDWYW